LPTSGSCENDIAEVSIPGVETQPLERASKRPVSWATSGGASRFRFRGCAGIRPLALALPVLRPSYATLQSGRVIGNKASVAK